MSQGNIIFRLRGVWFGLIFWAGFSLYSFDHRNVIDAISHFANQHWGWSADAVSNALLAVMAACGVLAAAIRTWASAYLSASVVHDSRLHSELLVADGPYRHLRNPLYLGTLLIAIGFAFMASRLGAVVIVVGISLLIWNIISIEEAGLLATQGEQYREYLRAVPRLLPSLMPRVRSSGRRPDWSNGFRAELYMWAFAAGGLAFAITNKLRLFFAGIALGVVILAVEGIVASSKKKWAASS
jgi:protein-S-isoprenylcysteine O-methyltransferase Ste14